jgi:hypothetical protein
MGGTILPFLAQPHTNAMRAHEKGSNVSRRVHVRQTPLMGPCQPNTHRDLSSSVTVLDTRGVVTNTPSQFSVRIARLLLRHRRYVQARHDLGRASICSSAASPSLTAITS